MNFSDLLKSIDHQREQERLKKESGNPRASNLRGQMGAERGTTADQNGPPGDRPTTLKEEGVKPTALHETRQVRDAEREKSGATRDVDLGHKVGSTTTETIDVFVAQRAVPVANKLMQLYEKALSETHIQEEALSKWSRFQQELPTYRQRMTDEANATLFERQHLLTEQGVTSETDEHIKVKLDAIILQLEENSRSLLMYAEARLRWLISGGEDTMSLEESNAQRKDDP